MSRSPGFHIRSTRATTRIHVPGMDGHARNGASGGPARPHHRRDGGGGAVAAVADSVSELPDRAVFRCAEDGRHRRLPVHLRRSGFLAGVDQFGADRDGDGDHRRAARRVARLRHGADRPPGQALDRAAAAGSELRVADGPRIRLRRRRGPGRLLHGMGDRMARRRAVGHLLAGGDRHHRRAHARPQRLRLRLGRAEEPRLGRRGGGARGRRVAVQGRADGEPAADPAGAAVFRGAGVLPGVRALRPAAGAGGPRRPPRALDVPVQAHQQARRRRRIT